MGTHICDLDPSGAYEYSIISIQPEPGMVTAPGVLCPAAQSTASPLRMEHQEASSRQSQTQGLGVLCARGGRG